MAKIKNINAKTKVCGIIGYPIMHSVSPEMHNAAFAALNLDYIYVPFEIKPGNLPRAIQGMRALGLRGLNVTVPHKIEVISLLDELDPTAEKIGAVNTIVNDCGNLKGYNTDAPGFIRGLIANGVRIKGKNVVILGAGGAARAIACSLSDQCAEITILNRKAGIKRARDLAAGLKQVYRTEFKVLVLNKPNLKKVIMNADILVNATSVGMYPEANESPVPLDLLKPDLIVYDIVYNPVETKLIKEAKHAGAKTIGGIEMLVAQGAISFKLWTGQRAPLEVMKKAAEKALRNEI